jgi:hypothetical protein
VVIRLRKIRWAGHAARADDKNVCRLLVEESEGKRLFDISSGRTILQCVDRINVAKDREKWWAVVKTVTNTEVPCNTNFLNT